MIKTRTWILLTAALLLLSAAAALLLHSLPAGGTVANIYQDGVLIRSVDLSAVEESYTFSVSDERGENLIRVERGRISVCGADCPDKLCVKMGWRSESASPIVCLPHRLVIRIEKNAAEGLPDAVSK